LPDEVKYLATLKQDEAGLVDAARRFELQQFALADWDQKLIEEYSRDGQANLAQTQKDTMERRAKLIRTVWEWVLEQYPNNARANNYFGEYLFDYAGDEAGGLQHWMTAAQLDDNLGAAHNNLGIYYFHTGEYAHGLEQLEKALKLEPDNPDYLYNMAQMYLIHFDQIEGLTKAPREKLYKRAMEMSAKAAELSPKDFDIVQDYAVNFFAAENFGAQADWKAAAEAWRKAQPIARTEDERFYTLLNEARACLNGGDAKSAVAPLEAAMAIHKDSVAAQQLLAKAKQAP
jgi:tetratricopeptide (TPR) repeat protein